MRHLYITIIALLLTALTIPQVNAQEAQAFLRVKRQSSGKKTAKNWETSWGSFDRDYTRSVCISIFVKGMGKTAPATLECYFIARDLNTGKAWIFDSDKSEITLDSAKPDQLEKTSRDIAASVQNYQALGMRDKAGSRIDGYIVRVVAKDKVLAVDASSRQLEMIGKDSAKLAELASNVGSEM
ncbi:MAG: hypothetical protein GX599_02145 [Chloroflexi bacterium]|nr:hypothetical protein [Chloroflexota bacterium]